MQVRDTEIKSIRQDDVDFIYLTEIAKLRNNVNSNGIIANWMRNRYPADASIGFRLE